MARRCKYVTQTKFLILDGLLALSSRERSATLPNPNLR